LSDDDIDEDEPLTNDLEQTRYPGDEDSDDDDEYHDDKRVIDPDDELSYA